MSARDTFIISTLILFNYKQHQPHKSISSSHYSSALKMINLFCEGRLSCYCFNRQLQIIYIMDSSVPLLNLEQIQQLNLMIDSISLQNRKSLEDLIGEQLEIQNATIMQLYNYSVEEWTKKQKIIDNLCHFSLTMMSTVEYLWGQKDTHEERLSNAELMIENLNRHLLDIGDENQIFKRKISEAEFNMEEIAVEKQKIEELYRTQSCINFISLPQKAIEEIVPQIEEQSKECQIKRHFQEERSKLIDQSIKLLDEKESEIFTLREQKVELEKKLSTLLEDHQLVKIEVQLAEIAVKDALSYRQSSILNSSQSGIDQNYQEQIYTTKSHAQFMNGDLQCFSNLNQSCINEKRNQLLNEVPVIEHFKCKTQPSCPVFDASFESCSAYIQETTEDMTTTDNPFKKKVSKISQISESFMLKESMLTMNNLTKAGSQRPTLLSQNKKTVSLQCNLIKGLPRLSFGYEKNLYEQEYKPKVKPVASPDKKQMKKLSKKQKVVKVKVIQPKIALSKSEIVKPSVETAPLKKSYVELKADSSLSKFYSFFSSKVISQRIKVK